LIYFKNIKLQNHIKKKIFYWSPGFVKIATFKAVINSAKSIAQFDHNHEATIINFFGEFDEYKNELSTKKIKLINFFNKKILKFLPKYGFIKSRFSFCLIFVLSFFPLKNLLNDKKPDYIIIHLVSSLPLILLILFNFRTKFILRISGYPHLNYFRRIIWKAAFKKIYAVTCPTLLTKKKISKLNYIDEKKLHLLYDPVIDVKHISKLKKSSVNVPKSNFFLAAGRLTKQKNFEFLIKAYEKFIYKSNKILLIAGEGESYKKLQKLIKFKNLSEKILLIGHLDNIYKYMSRCEAFILTSLWEDPGFVIIEAAFCRAIIISSDCKNGPVEFLENDTCGFSFETNNLLEFEKKFKLFSEADSTKILQKKKSAIKKTNLYTRYYHFKSLKKILEKNIEFNDHS
jgi:glycosyltransferase involved in cell wall biosynthesis